MYQRRAVSNKPAFCWVKVRTANILLKWSSEIERDSVALKSQHKERLLKIVNQRHCSGVDCQGITLTEVLVEGSYSSDVVFGEGVVQWCRRAEVLLLWLCVIWLGPRMPREDKLSKCFCREFIFIWYICISIVPPQLVCLCMFFF